MPEHGGCGYAFEIASATMVYARETFGISEIYAITLAENSKSIRLLEKLGLTYIKNIRFPGNKEELLLFSTAVGQAIEKA